MRLFNKNFFKFVYGFMGMIAIGLFGIILVGYLISDDVEDSVPVAEAVEAGQG